MTQLIPMLEEWAKLHKEYAEATSESLYYDCEATQNSILVSAANRKSKKLKPWFGVAESYCLRKNRGHGRVDVYLSHTKNRYFIETKKEWLNVFRRNLSKLPANVEKSISASRNQVEQIDLKEMDLATYDTKRLFGCYLIAYTHQRNISSTPQPLSDELIQEKAIDPLAEHFDILAWSFPKELDDDFSRDGKYLYSGTILGLRDYAHRSQDRKATRHG